MHTDEPQRSHDDGVSDSSSIQAHDITITSGSITFPAYLARPDREGTFPGVIVIHEIFGLTDQIKDVTRRFADQGYAALAVDLFAGRNRTVCMFRFMGQQIFSPLANESTQGLKDALTYLAARPECDGNRIGAIGFCMGGGFAIAWACTDDRLKVIAPFYGGNPKPLEAVARLCPVVGSYPEKDFTAAQAKKLEGALEQYHIPHDIKIYPNTRHSFFNDQRGSYDPAASRDAWQRVLAYFQLHLG